VKLPLRKDVLRTGLSGELTCIFRLNWLFLPQVNFTEVALVPAVCYWHWRSASPLHVFARGAETWGKQSSQQGIHTSNPASPSLSQKSGLLAFGKHVMVRLFTKR